MDSTSSLFSIAYFIPGFLIAVIGLVISLQYMKTQRRRAILAAGAFGLQLFGVILSIVGQLMVFRFMSSDWGSGQIGIFYSIQGFIHVILNIAVWILILLALFKSDT